MSSPLGDVHPLIVICDQLTMVPPCRKGSLSPDTRRDEKPAELLMFGEVPNAIITGEIHMLTLIAFLETLRSRDERGATAVEYGLMVALIAVAIILAVTALGDGLFNLFNGIVDDIGGTPATAP
jgi:pilus assembly protein Flp/PilA